MGHPGNQTWTWILWVFFCATCVGPTLAEPYYMVTIPAVLEAGTQTKFCASLMEPNETLTMTVTLRSQENNTMLLEKTFREEFLECIQFQVPLVKNEEVQTFEVKVRGNTFYSEESRKVLIKAYQPMTLIQTDKPIYLPGQTVHFRVVSMDTKFRPINQLYTIIELEDPNKNRIGQWLNEASTKILQLSYSLNSEAREGSYNIIVTVGGLKNYHPFKVEKYVLPKFDVNLNVKEEICITQKEFETKVCSKYTFGQPVPGNVTVKVCRPLEQSRNPEEPQITPPCETKTKQVDTTGCTTFEFKMSSFTKIRPDLAKNRLDISATVEEEGTGVSHSQMMKIQLSYVIGKLAFVDLPEIYVKGSNLEGKVKAVHCNGMPISNMTLYLIEGHVWSSRLLQNLTTDSNGFATFTVSTDTFDGDIFFGVSSLPRLRFPPSRTAYIPSERLIVRQFQPPSADTKTTSSLKIKTSKTTLLCDKEVEISINYTFVLESQSSVNIMYLNFMVDGNTAMNEGMVSFKLHVSPDMAPLIQVVVYAVLSNQNMIAHNAEFSTEKCFSNKVSVEFSPSSAVPGEETKLQLTAQPDSLCGVSAIDQSVLIKEPGKTLDEDRIFAFLPVRKILYIPYKVHDPRKCWNVRMKRYFSPTEIEEARTVFQRVGLKTATNLLMSIPTCLKFKGREYNYVPLLGSSSPVGKRGEAGSMAPEPVKTVRTFFPETWIWDMVETGSSGTKNVSLTVPDTITTWETETFCLSPQGFGLAPRQKLTVFQPFFLELTLPYSIIRGENFELKATVFNYLTKCIMVRVTGTPSSDYSLIPLSGDQHTSCLCANERKTFSWTMNPTALGVVNVTVTAEAVPSHISCGNEIVSVPERGRVDVVTRSLIVKAEGIETSKTYNWLVFPKGYQRQLNYKDSQGAYSTFGKGLTAFVLRSFYKAQSFVYIDPTKIDQSKTWLEQKQRSSGCFEQSGQLVHKSMKGGVSDEVTLSAYITAAFLEMKISTNDFVVRKSLSCLRESTNTFSNTYTTALLAYVFALAGDMETRNHLLQHLDSVAIKQGEFWWK
ncbi:hypothetical protein CCH79_00012155 [Gambusia affinis]|uniref:Alpha-2-macroglobulin domain-containing protein n=1 Tax=Gambusia affinis TaxID=33528 RepID=A0A315VZY4_GAMAF|nr:hypothetical protein CCH79_00012155 [Gambusia affinis]